MLEAPLACPWLPWVQFVWPSYVVFFLDKKVCLASISKSPKISGTWILLSTVIFNCMDFCNYFAFLFATPYWHSWSGKHRDWPLGLNCSAPNAQLHLPHKDVAVCLLQPLWFLLKNWNRIIIQIAIFLKYSVANPQQSLRHLLRRFTQNGKGQKRGVWLSAKISL